MSPAAPPLLSGPRLTTLLASILVSLASGTNYVRDRARQLPYSITQANAHPPRSSPVREHALNPCVSLVPLPPLSLIPFFYVTPYASELYPHTRLQLTVLPSLRPPARQAALHLAHQAQPDRYLGQRCVRPSSQRSLTSTSLTLTSAPSDPYLPPMLTSTPPTSRRLRLRPPLGQARRRPRPQARLHLRLRAPPGRIHGH